MDKMYLMLPEFAVSHYKVGEAKKAYEQEVQEPTDELFTAYLNALDSEQDAYFEAPESYQEWFKKNKERFKREKPKVYKIEYDHSKPMEQNSRKQRNNLLIDISRGVLTNADTVDKFVSPGSFDKLKRIARISDILDNPVMLKKALALTKEPDVPLIGEDKNGNTAINKGIFGLTDDQLKDITSSIERDPLSPRTFFYYHKQNMTGGALIGMYANNTTLFAKFQSKDQSITRMNLNYLFTVNGHTYNRLDGIYSSNGDIISKNCAEFSAASVDNVKDPVLAKLMQSTDTANLTALMLRVGMSIDEIGLLFTQPIIKDWINSEMPLKEDEEFLSLIRPLINDRTTQTIYSMIEDDSLVTNSDISIVDLVFGKVLRNNPEYSQQLNQTQNDNLDISQAKILLLMIKLYETSQQLNRVTKVARADSPNGAMATSIAGAIIQKQRVERLRTASKLKDWTINGVNIYNNIITPEMSKEDLRTAIMHSRFPMLQAFYSLGIDFGQSLMKDYFIQYNDSVTNIVNELSMQCNSDTLDEKQLNNVFKAFIKYELSGLGMFKGKDFNETRDFYLSQFPNRFMRFKHSHPEYANISILKKISQDNQGNLQFERSARLTPAMKDSFMRDLNSLLYRDDIETAQQLAMDLFTYAYFKDGFFFGPNSYGTFFSTQFITQIPEFVNGLRALDSYNDSKDASNFLGQFLVNNLRGNILRRMPWGKDPITGEYKVARKAGIDPRTGEFNIVMRTKYVLNPKDIDGLGKARVRKYFSYTDKNEDGSEHKFLAELTSTGKDYTTYRLVPEADSRLSVRQSDGSGKLVFVGARYNKSMDYHNLAAYRVSSEQIKAYYQADEDNPEYIMDTNVDPEISESQPKEQLKYTAETNLNKENWCK